MVERFAAYEQMLIANPTKFGERLLTGLLLGGFFTGSDYVEALRRRREMCNEMANAMADLDVMITATQRAEAPLIDSIPKYENFERPGFTSPFNVTGYPAMSICTGFGDKHLPIAMQIIAKPFAEPRLFRFAYAYVSKLRPGALSGRHSHPPCRPWRDPAAAEGLMPSAASAHFDSERFKMKPPPSISPSFRKSPEILTAERHRRSALWKDSRTKLRSCSEPARIWAARLLIFSRARAPASR